MNEMNNGGNEFNNQNMNNSYNQENYGYQNSNVNYQNVNNNQNAEPPKKNNALLIVALLIIIGLIGFIVYDKLVKKDEVKPEEQNQSEKLGHELVKFDNNQITKKENVTENGVNYYEVLTIKNADLVVDIKLFTEKNTSGSEDASGYDDRVKMDLYINGTKKDTLVLEEYFRCNINECDMMDSHSFDDIKAIWDERIRTLVGTIKGDKYYLYLNFERDNSSIYIIDADGKVLDTSSLKFYGGAYGSISSMELSSSCQTYQYASSNSDPVLGTYFIREDAIYYLKFSKNYDENSLGNEYKITVANGQVKTEKIGSCQISAYGEKFIDEEYYDNN